ncbi:MAG: DMT family transporter [Pseudobdellovibrionaceae bacterium]
MNSLALYSLSAAIWGSTWLVITFQLGAASPMVSVFLRFLLATVLSFGLVLVLKKPLVFSRRNHLFFALQGLFNFSLNYNFTYFSETMIPSGLVAVTFTLVIYFNILGLRFIYGKSIDRKVIISALLGASGIFLIFQSEIEKLGNPQQTMLGLALGVIATFFASCGNMVTVRNAKHKLDVLSVNTWSMLYGSLCTLVFILISGQPWSVDWSLTYVSSLFYLSIFGTVIAFWAYLTLIGNIGADRAAYISVITPVIAIGLSLAFEGYELHSTTVIGVVLCLLGNYFVLSKPTRDKNSRSSLQPK